MKTYKSNRNYIAALSMGMAMSAIGASISVLFFLQTGSYLALSLLIPATALLYLTLFAIPREISLEPDRIILRSLCRTTSMDLKGIKGVRELYNSAALNRVDGDTEKVDKIYFLRFEGKPWRIVFFGNHIMEYRDLAARLKELT